MRSETRRDEDSPRRRSLARPDDPRASLAGLVAVWVAAAICAAAIVCAIELRGIPHEIAVVLAVLSGLFVAVWITWVLLALGGMLVITGTADGKPSAGQRLINVASAAGFGALLGVGTYSMGILGLLAGPMLIVLVVAALWIFGPVTPLVRRVALEMSIVVGVTTLVLDLTIFR